jgi:predicted Fe-Mo cluster-binding NifX family protein
MLVTMKLAFPTRDDQTISAHFGKMKALIVIEVVDGAEVTRERRDMSDMPACGSEHSHKPRFVIEMISDCDVLIAGGVGTAMLDKANEAGVEVVLTRERTIAKAIDRYTTGTLDHSAQLAHAPR